MEWQSESLTLQKLTGNVCVWDKKQTNKNNKENPEHFSTTNDNFSENSHLASSSDLIISYRTNWLAPGMDIQRLVPCAFPTVQYEPICAQALLTESLFTLLQSGLNLANWHLTAWGLSIMHENPKSICSSRRNATPPLTLAYSPDIKEDSHPMLASLQTQQQILVQQRNKTW